MQSKVPLIDVPLIDACAGWAFLATGIADTATGTAASTMEVAIMRKSGRTF